MDDHFVMLVRKNGLGGMTISKDNSLDGRIERRREELSSRDR